MKIKAHLILFYFLAVLYPMGLLKNVCTISLASDRMQWLMSHRAAIKAFTSPYIHFQLKKEYLAVFNSSWETCG